MSAISAELWSLFLTCIALATKKMNKLNISPSNFCIMKNDQWVISQFISSLRDCDKVPLLFVTQSSQQELMQNLELLNTTQLTSICSRRIHNEHSQSFSNVLLI